jgi:tetratricopeptide (TPR) repeat protein
MRPFLNFRLLWVTLAVILLTGGSIVAAAWYGNRPGNLLHSAGFYHDQGEKALAAHDTVAARRHFQSADNQLERLLSRQPKHSAALLLRSRVLQHLAVLTAAEEREGAASDRPSQVGDLVRQSTRCLREAASDPSAVEAAGLMLDYCFRADNLEEALPYARCVLEHPHEAPANLPSWPSFLAGAHYVLARAALADTPPRVEETIEHLQQSQEASEGAAALRWRLVGMEMAALKARADLAPSPEAATDTLRLLRQERLPKALARLRQELGVVRPTGEGHSERPALAELSPTDTRGVLDALRVALLVADEDRILSDRVELTLDVCTQFQPAAERRPRLHLEMSSCLVALAQAVTEHPTAAADWPRLAARLESLATPPLKAGTPVDPIFYLHLARGSRRQERLDEAVQFARQGLVVVQQRGLPPDAPTARNLHVELACLLLYQNKPLQAEEHLSLLRQNKQGSSVAFLLAGLAGVRDGRLEDGLRDLKQAQEYADLHNNPHLHAGLGAAYLGLGQPERALPHLLQARAAWGGSEGRGLPSEGALDLELCRCYLALGRFDDAQQFRQRLQGKPEEPAAVLLLLAASRTQEPEVQSAVRADLAGLRRRQPRDARLALAEAQLLAGDAAGDPPFAGRTALVLAALSPDLGAQLAAVRRLVRLPVADVARADRLMVDFSHQGSGKDFEAMLAWVRWLQRRGRLAEAEQTLVRMAEGDFPEQRRYLQLLRGQLLLARGEGAELEPLLRQLQTEQGDPRSDFLELFFLLGSQRDLDTARGKLDHLLGQYESNGLLHLWQGQLAQMSGDPRQAVNAYAYALCYTRLRPAARQGLLACLLDLSRKESPSAVQTLTAELLRSHPGDLVLLAVYAEMAARLDRVKGPDGMLAALSALEQALRQEKRDPAVSAYCKACGLVAVRRADLARGELQRGLAVNPRHAPSLVLAGQLALEAEDWKACRATADALAEVQPEGPEPWLWRAAILERQGYDAEAGAAWQEVCARFPQLAAGWLGTARVLERRREFAAALDRMRRGGTSCPDKLALLEAQVRLLGSSGQVPAAEAAAEQALRNVKEQKRSAVEALRLREAVARGFVEAGALDAAESWLEKQAPLVPEHPESDTREALTRMQLLRGDIWVARGQQTHEPLQRTRCMDAAIEAYRKAQALSPDDGTAANNLAWLLAQERHDGKAALAFVPVLRRSRAGELLSGDRLSLPVLDTLGVVYCVAGHAAEAVQLFEEASGRYRQEPVVYLHLARAYAVLGDAAKAEASGKAALSCARARAAAVDSPRERARWEQQVVEIRAQLGKSAPR